MKQLLKIGWTAAFLVTAIITQACDVCGCIASDMGFGFIPVQNNSIIGLNINNRNYTTTHSISLGETETSQDRFISTSLWARYSIKNKVLLQANLPYHWSNVEMEQDKYSNQGLGDLSALAYFQILQFQNQSKDIKIRWLLGSGIKAPTANYNKKSGALFIQNIQNGSGSWDVPIGSNLALIFSDIGINNETQYWLNGKNDLNFKYGNTWNSKSMLFYRLRWNKSMIIPQLGYVFEHQEKDLIQATEGIERYYSGKSIHDLYVGLDLYKKKYGVRFNSRINIYSDIAENSVDPKSNLNIQLLYFID